MEGGTTVSNGHRTHIPSLKQGTLVKPAHWGVVDKGLKIRQ
ncbi:MAG: hypothetical protein OJF47_002510 [Nitrospira sp.]|nr:MAG: hypothetical protein OJF47_002510 [Nitrospira sp.]